MSLSPTKLVQTEDGSWKRVARTQEEINAYVAAKEAELLAMYAELKALKGE